MLLYLLVLYFCHPFGAGLPVHGAQESCSLQQYPLVISKPGCRNTTIVNYFCAGKCFSGFIPENRGQNTCRSCKPSKTITKSIPLSCQNGPQTLDIEVFVQCSCSEYNCNQQKKTEPPSATRQTADEFSPCRKVCRKSRRSKRNFEKVAKRRIQVTALQVSCRTAECRRRIENSKSVFERYTRVKQKMKKLNQRCKECKQRKKHGGLFVTTT